MSNDKYVLDGKIPKLEPDLIKWAMWFETAKRSVAENLLNSGDVKISTVFLGLDHSSNGGEPILFETMIFGGEHDQCQERYATWDEAEAGHKKALELVENPPTTTNWVGEYAKERKRI